jgi:hypothetical protein
MEAMFTIIVLLLLLHIQSLKNHLYSSFGQSSCTSSRNLQIAIKSDTKTAELFISTVVPDAFDVRTPSIVKNCASCFSMKQNAF